MSQTRATTSARTAAGSSELWYEDMTHQLSIFINHLSKMVCVWERFRKRDLPFFEIHDGMLADIHHKYFELRTVQKDLEDMKSILLNQHRHIVRTNPSSISTQEARTCLTRPP